MASGPTVGFRLLATRACNVICSQVARSFSQSSPTPDRIAFPACRFGTSCHTLKPMYPNSIIIYFGPNVTYIGSTLRPMYILYGYMDPSGYSSLWYRCLRGSTRRSFVTNTCSCSLPCVGCLRGFEIARSNLNWGYGTSKSMK